MTTMVANIRNLPPEWKDNPGYQYIGRSGHGHDGYFGNPYHLAEGEARGSTLQEYRAYAAERLLQDEMFRSRVYELRGKTLVCFCKPNPCHGDILAELADALEAAVELTPGCLNMQDLNKIVSQFLAL